MKKKIVISVLVILAVVLSSIVFTRPKALGNMMNTFDRPTTNMSDILFSGQANDKIKFSFKSNVKAGVLDIVLYDSNGTVVFELDKAKALETYYTLEKADMYTLSVEYSDFVGSYKVTVYKTE